MDSPTTSTTSTTSSPLLGAQLLANKATTGHGLDAFLARAELSKVTRALRARLSYASYKATNNLAHVPLHTLEQQHEANAPRSSRATSPDHNIRAIPSSQGKHLNQSRMMPPPAAPSLYSVVISNSTKSNTSPPSSPAHKRARRSPADASPKASSSTSRRTSPPPRSAPIRRKKARATSPSTRSAASTRSTRGRTTDVDMMDGGRNTTELEDLSAAAALTSLLHNNTPHTANNSSGSGASVPHSPTPSHASSLNEGVPLSRRESMISQSGMSSSTGRVLSPPMSIAMASSAGVDSRRATPKPASDADAAEMMLYLATSPSPARPAVRRPLDRPLIQRGGRVLFPSSQSGSSAEDGDTPSKENQTTPRAQQVQEGEAGPSRHAAAAAYAKGHKAHLSHDADDDTEDEIDEYSAGLDYPSARVSRPLDVPDIIYAGELLSTSPTLPGTVFSQQTLTDSQVTAVDPDIHGNSDRRTRTYTPMTIDDDGAPPLHQYYGEFADVHGLSPGFAGSSGMGKALFHAPTSYGRAPSPLGYGGSTHETLSDVRGTESSVLEQNASFLRHDRTSALSSGS